MTHRQATVRIPHAAAQGDNCHLSQWPTLRGMDVQAHKRHRSQGVKETMSS